MWSLRPGETYEKMVLPVLSPDPNTDETWRMLGCWGCVHQSNKCLDQLIADFDAGKNYPPWNLYYIALENRPS